VYQRVQKAVRGKKGEAAAEALRVRLDKINKTFPKKGIKYLGLDEMPDRRKKK
jgi:hypothetical protein